MKPEQIILKSIATYNKKMSFDSAADYYCFGELAYLYTTISWFMQDKHYARTFKNEHNILQKAFIERANFLNVDKPKKNKGEMQTEYIINYVVKILEKLGYKSDKSAFFSIGYKVMAVKLMEFTQDEENIVRELLDYLRVTKIDVGLIDNIELELRSQLTKPRKNFLAKFELLENELKNKLFSEVNISKKEEPITFSQNDQPLIKTEDVTSPPTISNKSISRYSFWCLGICATGIASVAIGLALSGQEVTEEINKTTCSIQ